MNSSPLPNQAGEGQTAPEQAGSASTSTAVTADATLASPLQSAEAYENMCGICFTEIHPVDNPRGRLNSCNHLFCSYCIKEWAKNTNVCPSCKARFTRIYTFNAATQQEEETKVRRRNYKAWELTYYDDDEAEEEEDEDEASTREEVVCAICQQSHNAARMIFCDRRQCPYAAHLDCLGLAERPLTFLCPQCTQLREQEDESEHNTTAATSPSAVPHLVTSTTTTAAVTAPPKAAVTSSRADRAAATTTTATLRRSTRISSTTAGAPAAHRPNAHRPSAASAARVGPPVPASRALYGGSRSNSGTSSSSSSSSSPSLSASTRPTPAAPRVPIDFSKPHIPVPLRTTTTTRVRHPHLPGSPADSSNADAIGDDYYFLSPTSHTVAATIELARTNENRAAEAQTRRRRERAKAERLESAYGVNPHHVRLQSGRKRPQGTAAEALAAELAAAEMDFTNPQRRRDMEERMVRRWAADILPVLRRRRYIEGDTVTSEADMWSEATVQARKMVREKLDAKGTSLRRRREQLVQAQAKREAAALAKLARIIAQHREQEKQK